MHIKNLKTSFRDFIILYITEGYRRTTECVALGNSNPSIIKLAHYWIKNLSKRKIIYTLRIHKDHNYKKSIIFWSSYLSINKENIKYILKNNSCLMKTRNWRNEHGILTIATWDTYLKTKIDAYIDYLEKEWSLYRGVA